MIKVEENKAMFMFMLMLLLGMILLQYSYFMLFMAIVCIRNHAVL